MSKIQTYKYIPKFVFIVPYRDREKHKEWFINNIKDVANKNNHFFELYFIHQNDSRIFNRGAMKNFGFIFIKKKYPKDYKGITLVFHDVDTFPTKDVIFDYYTNEKIVKHFYGFHHTLGGIVSIRAKNFEHINGFPNYWGWGFEDNVFQDRCKKREYTIDRDHFYKINDESVHHFQDERYKVFNATNIDRVENDNKRNGLLTLLNYNIREEQLESDYMFMVHITGFDCEYDPLKEKFQTHDLAKGNVIMKNYKQSSMKMIM